ncbi:MAG: gamma-glutamyl-gamma-aminobutyrate hydrolase family protein [Fusobacteriaceae bacterium]|jgi:putative glutamine amidotransferase|nr:gamma-glutamyl-gamma-aminobutyrate hydrolase family protein [Fusobacteriaceae bacterium]
MKPVIGITMSREKKDPGYFIKQHYGYISSVERAGGLPVLIPLSGDIDYLREFMTAVNMKGLIIAGGEDVHPFAYGEDTSVNVHYTDPLRDETEFAVLAIARERKMPVFGICRGLQLINVAYGGTLYQHIDAELPGALGHHPAQYERHGLAHKILIEKDSFLYPIFAGEDGEKAEIAVNSVHHQGVKDFASDVLRAVARSRDGLIEAFEHKDMDGHFLFAVQWHPEGLSHLDPKQLEIFKRFIERTSAQN